PQISAVGRGTREARAPVADGQSQRRRQRRRHGGGPIGPDGTLSLREAIELVNLACGGTIDFAVSTVTPMAALPLILGPVTINGSGVTIDGSQAGSANGLECAALGNTVRGLTINNFAGTQLQFYAGNNTIQGNFVGTDSSGMTAVGGGGTASTASATATWSEATARGMS